MAQHRANNGFKPEADRSNVPDMPAQAPYARHVFICTGAYCDPAGKARHIYRRLSQKLGELGDYDNPVRVKRGITPCLGVCFGGPILVVYPEGIWYHHVDDDLLDRIVEEHLRQGKPVQEHIFHRLEACSGPEGVSCMQGDACMEVDDVQEQEARGAHMIRGIA